VNIVKAVNSELEGRSTGWEKAGPRYEGHGPSKGSKH
jgi:hypothetical protein